MQADVAVVQTPPDRHRINLAQCPKQPKAGLPVEEPSLRNTIGVVVNKS
jgi:hypothetical protein